MELFLSGGRTAIIDDEDAPKTVGFAWYAARNRRTWYAQATVGTRADGRTTAYLHRIVLGTATGVSIDHINGDGLDCRKSNLRLATPSQQNANQRKRSGATSSKYRGVYASRDRNGKTRWRVEVCANGHRRRASCVTETDAALVYNALARETFGEFAMLNEVPN